jgi:hypothetical protein
MSLRRDRRHGERGRRGPVGVQANFAARWAADGGGGMREDHEPAPPPARARPARGAAIMREAR